MFFIDCFIDKIVISITALKGFLHDIKYTT